MKLVTLLALLAVTLVLAFDALPKGSVGGALTLMLIFLTAALTMGLYEAWSKRRGVLGWIVNIVVSLAGGIAGASLFLLLPDGIFAAFQPEGALIKTRHPMLYVGVNLQMLSTVLGAWAALWLVNRLRA